MACVLMKRREMDFSFKIVPNFFQGHTYLWDVPPEFIVPFPWKFTVEKADVAYALPEDWKVISPVLTNVFAYVGDQVPKYNKDYSEQYRLKLQAGGKTFYSEPRTVFADIPKDDWCVIREIQRKEVLQMRGLSGVACQLWQRRMTGVVCTYCTSPSTGEVIDPDCAWCYGTGKLGGYHGPYLCWGTFSLKQGQKTYGENEQSGVPTDIRNHQIRLIGNPYIFQKDILADITSGRKYVVTKLPESILEIRRIAVIQNLYVAELATQDIANKLGTATPVGETDCQ